MKVLAVVAGFLVWSVVFVGGEQVTKAIAPQWAAAPDATYVGSIPILLTYLLRSIVASVASGFVASLISKDNNRIPFILAIVLLIVGVLVQVSAWTLLPVWYHLVFLALLVPMTMLGARLKSFE